MASSSTVNPANGNFRDFLLEGMEPEEIADWILNAPDVMQAMTSLMNNWQVTLSEAMGLTLVAQQRNTAQVKELNAVMEILNDAATTKVTGQEGCFILRDVSKDVWDAMKARLVKAGVDPAMILGGEPVNGVYSMKMDEAALGKQTTNLGYKVDRLVSVGQQVSATLQSQTSKLGIVNEIGTAAIKESAAKALETIRNFRLGG